MGRFVVKNVNFFLILVLMLSIIVSTGVSLYYEKRFSDISDDYIITLDRLGAAEKYQGLYLEAIQSLNSSSKSIQYYDTLYANKTAELETTREELTGEIGTLEQQLQDKRNELKRTADSLDAKIDALEDARDQLYSTEQALETLQGEFNSLSDKYDDVKDDLDKAEDKRDEYKDRLDQCQELDDDCDDGWND